MGLSGAKSVCWQAWIFGAPGRIHFPSFLACRGCPHSLAHGSPPHPKPVTNSRVFPVKLCSDPVILISSFPFKDLHDYTGTTQVVQNNLCSMISNLSSSFPCNIFIDSRDQDVNILGGHYFAYNSDILKKKEHRFFII